MKVKLIVFALAVLLIFAAACNSANNTPTQQPQTNDAQTENSQTKAEDIGEGANVFRFEVFDDEGNVSAWNVHTNETTVGAALLEVGLIEGEEFAFGLMVSHVNGIRADFTEDGAYWALYVDDEMSMVGVDSVDIEEGVTYAFVYTPA